jgi:hypothetical protein
MIADHGDVHHHAVRPPTLSDTHPTSISNPNTPGAPTTEVSALETSKHSCNTTISNRTAEPQDFENFPSTDEPDQGPGPENALLESFTSLLKYLTFAHKDLPPETRNTLISEFQYIRRSIENKKASNRACVHRIPQPQNNSQENNNNPAIKDTHEDTETALPKATAQEAKAEPEPEAETESETESEATDDTDSNAMLVDNPSNTNTDETSNFGEATSTFIQISKPKKKPKMPKKKMPKKPKQKKKNQEYGKVIYRETSANWNPSPAAIAYCNKLSKELREKELPVE